MELFDIVDYTIWLSAIVGIFFYQKLEPKSLKLLVIFVVVVIIFETIIPKLINIDTKHYYQRLYTIIRPIEFLIISYCFFDLRDTKSLKIKFILFMIVAYFLYASLLLITQYNDKFLGNNTSVVSYILLIALMIIYYKNLLSSNEIIQLKDSPLFIYSIGILIFCCGNVIVSGFYLKIAQENKEIARTLYKFMNYGLLIIKSITSIIALYIANKNFLKKYE